MDLKKTDLDSEINIFSLYDDIKSSKKILILCIFLSLTLGVIGNFIINPRFDSSIVVTELNNDQAFYFENNKLMSNTLGINFKHWYPSFANKFQANEILINNIKQGLNIHNNNDIDPYQLAKSFNFKSSDMSGDQKNISEIFFSSDYENYELLKSILISTLNDINNEIKEEIKSNFDSHIQSQKLFLDYELREEEVDYNFLVNDLKREIEKKEKTYLKKINLQLSFLEEQAKIARNLGIDTPTKLKFLNETGENYIFNGNEDYYNKGYLAIDEEIKALKNRNNSILEETLDDKHTLEGYGEMLEISKLKEMHEITINKQKTFFEYSPILEDDFFVFNYYLTDVNGAKEKKYSLIILMTSILIGLLIGSFMSILLINYKRYKNLNKI